MNRVQVEQKMINPILHFPCLHLVVMVVQHPALKVVHHRQIMRIKIPVLHPMIKINGIFVFCCFELILIYMNLNRYSTFHDSLNAKNYPQRGRDERKVSDVTNYNLDKHHRSDSQQSLKSSSSITANLSPTPRSDSMDNLRSTNVNVVPDLDPVQFQLKVDTTLKKYLDKQDYDDTYKEVQSFCSKTKCADFIAESILLAIDKTSQKCNPRERWGQFLGQFFCSSFCENTDIFERFVFFGFLVVNESEFYFIYYQKTV